MYGKDVTVNGVTVFVCGLPNDQQCLWVKKAKKIIRAKIK